MFNTANHERKAYQNHNDISLIQNEDDKSQENRNNNAGEMWIN